MKCYVNVYFDVPCLFRYVPTQASMKEDVCNVLKDWDIEDWETNVADYLRNKLYDDEKLDEFFDKLTEIERIDEFIPFVDISDDPDDVYQGYELPEEDLISIEYEFDLDIEGLFKKVMG